MDIVVTVDGYEMTMRNDAQQLHMEATVDNVKWLVHALMGDIDAHLAKLTDASLPHATTPDKNGHDHSIATPEKDAHHDLGDAAGSSFALEATAALEAIKTTL